MYNILVTGSKGQLGSEIRAITSSSSNTYFYTDVAELDITDKNAVNRYVKDYKINIVINCAAYTQVDKAEDDEEKAYLINATAAENLAVVCAQNSATLFHISTDYVFSGNSSLPYTETDLTTPLGVYGKSKRKAEELILQSRCRYLIFRTAWLYSSYGSNFVKTIGRLSGEKDELKVVFDQVGSPTYAADLASTIVQLINNESFIERDGIYHFSNEGVCSWYDFAIAINQFFENRCRIKPCHSDEFPSKVTRPHFSVLDKTKIKRDFEIEIPYWRDSLERCINLIRQV